MGLDIYFYNRKRVGYFRKVNFLVAFFEKEGYTLDNCEYVEIQKESIKKLINYCKQVLDSSSKASELLPTRDGFFFGSTKYDEFYYEDVRKVLDWAENVLPEFEDNSIDMLISY